MKKLLLLSAIAIIVGCGSPKQVQYVPSNTVPAPAPAPPTQPTPPTPSGSFTLTAQDGYNPTVHSVASTPFVIPVNVVSTNGWAGQVTPNATVVMTDATGASHALRAIPINSNANSDKATFIPVNVSPNDGGSFDIYVYTEGAQAGTYTVTITAQVIPGSGTTVGPVSTTGLLTVSSF